MTGLSVASGPLSVETALAIGDSSPFEAGDRDQLTMDYGLRTTDNSQ
jgi:hypothetical protein